MSSQQGRRTIPSKEMASREGSRRERPEYSSSTVVRRSEGLLIPPGFAMAPPLPGTSENPLTIPGDEDEEKTGKDKKPMINPLSRLKSFRLPNRTQVPSQNFADESAQLRAGVKKLLVSELISPSNVPMDINTMVDRANGAFDTLAYLRDDDMAFYDMVRSFINWYQDWVMADDMRKTISKEIIDQCRTLETESKKAQQAAGQAESNLLMEKNKVAILRENIKKLEQEMLHSEALVLMLAVETEKCQQYLYGINAEVSMATAKAKEMLGKIDERRKIAINGISEMTKQLRYFSM